MLGRGTRKGEQYPGQVALQVFDCFDGTLLEYFRDSTGDHRRAARASRRARSPQIIEDIWAEPGPRLQHPAAW